jgi:hypothetical protein
MEDASEAVAPRALPFDFFLQNRKPKWRRPFL